MGKSINHTACTTLFQRKHARNRPVSKFQQLVYLVDMSMNLVVENKGHQQLLNVLLRNV